MKLTNDSYVILMGTKNFTERYLPGQGGLVKGQRAGPEVWDDGRAGAKSSSSRPRGSEAEPDGEGRAPWWGSGMRMDD
jgi:hypothetical protein